jgi:RimJ/RimL family protein N-acetyltransferase
VEITPVVLEGKTVRLEPLRADHWTALADVGLHPDLWRWTASQVRTPEEMRRYVDTALREQGQGRSLPFVIVERRAEAIIGSTRYGNIESVHRRIEIGWTWVTPPWQRTAANTEAKYLLLRHAFETLGCIRVEFKTDVLNERSRTALLRIGAKEEGILRSHMITESGRVRDSVYFSILDREWPVVKSTLEAKL